MCYVVRVAPSDKVWCFVFCFFTVLHEESYSTWRFIKYSDALAPRYTKQSHLGTKTSEYFMNHQALAEGKFKVKRIEKAIFIFLFFLLVPQGMIDTFVV